MTAYRFATRRMILKDMGKAGLAIMVLGAGSCSTDPDGSATTTAATTPSTDGPEPTEAPETTTAPTTSEAPGTTVAASGQDWARANLGFVSAYVLYRGGEAAIVDTGTSGSGAAIGAALTEVGLGWDSVGHVILTHNHPDHQGGLQEILAEAPDAAWYSGAEDMAAVTAPTDGVVIADGDTVFDLEMIATPGHTAGHMVVLDSAASVMLAGDAIFEQGGAIVPSLPQFTADGDAANASIKKMATFDYEVMLFGHGEPILSGASGVVGELAATL